MTTKKKKQNKTGFTGKSRGEQHIVALHAPFCYTNASGKRGL